MKFSKKEIQSILQYIRRKSPASPSIGIICGSGLNTELSALQNHLIVPFSDIPHFPVPSVKGHKGRFIFGKLENKQVVIQEGRLHYYEGLPFDKILLPLFIMKQRGVETVIITNAAGGINRSFAPGDIMAVTNHINMMGVDPLVGRFSGNFADRFVDMRRPYDEKLIALTRRSARPLRIRLKEGIYLGDTGPQYETEAEVAAFRTLGADAVGMSLVPETIFARYLGMRVLALSVITNIYKRRELTMSHDKVVAQGKKAAAAVFSLIKTIVKDIS